MSLQQPFGPHAPQNLFYFHFTMRMVRGRDAALFRVLRVLFLLKAYSEFDGVQGQLLSIRGFADTECWPKRVEHKAVKLSLLVFLFGMNLP